MRDCASILDSSAIDLIPHGGIRSMVVLRGLSCSHNNFFCMVHPYVYISIHSFLHLSES